MTSLTTAPTSIIPTPDASRQLVRLRPRLVPHFPAVVFILTTLMLPIGAINGQNNLLFWIFGLAIAALLGSGILGAWTIASIRVERDPIPPCHHGEVAGVTYRITNRSRTIPAFAICISEVPDRPRAVRPARPEPTWHLRFTRGIAFAEFIPRGGTVVAHAEVAALSRGPAVFDTIEVWTGFPFGLSRKTILQAREQTALVRPRVAPLRPEFLSLIARSGEGRSAGATSRTGVGDEFHSLRELSEGDPPRSVAWKRSASADRLLVRQTARPVYRRLWIGVADLSTCAPDDAEHALQAAASLASAATTLGFAVGLLGAPGRAAMPPRQGQRALNEILDVLGAWDPSTGGGPAPVTTLRAAVVVVDPRRASWPGGGIVAAPSDIIGQLPRPVPEGTRAQRFAEFVRAWLPRRVAGLLTDGPAPARGRA